jgi:CheY-like chemotaxis protein
LMALIGIVDDDEAIRQFISSLVRAAGYQSVMFASGLAFLNALGTHSIDCAIVDFSMPELSGLELQRRLREINRPIPIIVVTARPDEVRATALEYCAVAVLGKSSHPEALLAALRSALDPEGQLNAPGAGGQESVLTGHLTADGHRVSLDCEPSGKLRTLLAVENQESDAAEQCNSAHDGRHRPGMGFFSSNVDGPRSTTFSRVL